MRDGGLDFAPAAPFPSSLEADLRLGLAKQVERLVARETASEGAWSSVTFHSLFTTGVKSDHCSMRKARMSRTDFGNHVRLRRAWMARNSLAMSSSSLT